MCEKSVQSGCFSTYLRGQEVLANFQNKQFEQQTGFSWEHLFLDFMCRNILKTNQCCCASAKKSEIYSWSSWEPQAFWQGRSDKTSPSSSNMNKTIKSKHSHSTKSCHFYCWYQPSIYNNMLSQQSQHHHSATINAVF